LQRGGSGFTASFGGTFCALCAGVDAAQKKPAAQEALFTVCSGDPERNSKRERVSEADG
jgi:hypothetical protein